MFLTFLSCAALVTPAPDSHWVSLAWDKTDATEIAGYRLYWGIAPRTYDKVRDVGNVTRATIFDLNECTKYFFALRAYNSRGTEGDFSAEVTYAVPPSPPAPVLQSFIDPDGTFVMTFHAAPFSDWTVWISDNLCQWQPTAWLTVGPTGYGKFEDWVDPEITCRYYRLQKGISGVQTYGLNPSSFY